jgi:DNA polymerase III delta prime subunit
LSYWAREGGGKGEIQPDDYKRIIQEVFLPDFKLARPFPIQLRDERETLVRLTNRQYEILNTFLQVNKRALIQGYAGTGKTTIALLKARELTKEGKNVLFLCYNELLASYLQMQLQDQQNIHVSNYHAFAKHIIEKHSRYIWPKYPAQTFWEEVVADQLFDTIGKNNIVYDAVIVDEAQDIRPNWWPSIELMVQKKSPFYIFYDPYQNIYDTEAELPELPTTLPLTENCRTTQNINKSICVFGFVDIKDSGFNPPGLEVEQRNYRDETELKTILVRTLKYFKQELQLRSGNILLLSPSSYQKSIFGRSPHLDGYVVQEYTAEKPKENEIYYESIYAFKGLDADAVVVFGVSPDGVTHKNDLLYVASSRARHILYLLTCSADTVIK